MRRIFLFILLFGILIAVPSFAQPLKFGVDAGGIEKMINSNTRPDYGTFWVGAWNLPEGGWKWVESDLEKMKQKNVTPVIQFFYWGDDLNKDCLENGCWSSLHNSWKSKEGWNNLTIQFLEKLNQKMEGREVVVILETEFNKATYEPLDGYLEEKSKQIKEGYPAATVVLGFGNWGWDNWKIYDRAASSADLIGIQAMAGSTKDPIEHYYGLPFYTLDGAKKAKELFNKEIMITDVALSTYPEPEYVYHQNLVIQTFFNKSAEYAEAGVVGIIYRSVSDVDMDTANYYGEAERHWGMIWKNGTWKPSYISWIQGIEGQRVEKIEEVKVLPEPPRQSQGSVGGGGFSQPRVENTTNSTRNPEPTDANSKSETLGITGLVVAESLPSNETIEEEESLLTGIANAFKSINLRVKLWLENLLHSQSTAN